MKVWVRKLTSWPASLSSRLPDRLRRFCEKQMLVILLFILFGDSFKWGGVLGVTKYNWMQGHFADIGLPAQVTTALYYWRGHEQSGRVVALVLPPVLFSLYELGQRSRFDLVDVGCYVSGSVIALVSLSLYREPPFPFRR